MIRKQKRNENGNKLLVLNSYLLIKCIAVCCVYALQIEVLFLLVHASQQKWHSPGLGCFSSPSAMNC